MAFNKWTAGEWTEPYQGSSQANSWTQCQEQQRCLRLGLASSIFTPFPTPVVPLVVVRPGRLRKDTISCQSALLVELSINTYCPSFQIHSQSPTLRHSAFHFPKPPLLFHTYKETKSPSPSTSGHALRMVFIRLFIDLVALDFVMVLIYFL